MRKRIEVARTEKGPNAQREVAKKLKVWWDQVDPQAAFASTPLSGGWKNAPEFKACGDVMCSKPFPFSVEVKRREKWDLQNVIKAKRSPVWAWWLQTQRDGARMKQEPMLWFRKNRQGWWVMLRAHYIERVRGANAPDVVYLSRAFADMDVGDRPCIYQSTRFLQLDPNRMKEIL